MEKEVMIHGACRGKNPIEKKVEHQMKKRDSAKNNIPAKIENKDNTVNGSKDLSDKMKKNKEILY